MSFFNSLLSRTYLTFFFWILSSHGAFAQEPTEITDALISRLAKKNGIPSSFIGASVVEVASGNSAIQHHTTTQFVPASTLKILTAWMALEVLGPEFRFQTTVRAYGEVDQGTLNGSIVLTGDGDPYLTMNDLANLARKLVTSLQAKGIHQFKGQFYFDDRLLSKTPILDPLGDRAETYNPGLSALSFEFNRLALSKKRTPRLKPSLFTPIPPLHYLSLDLKKRSLKASEKFEQKTGTDSEVFLLSKNHRYKNREEIPTGLPSLYASETFRILVKQWGLDLPLPSPVPTPFPASETPLALQTEVTQQSDPLPTLVKTLLEYSNNTMGELLLHRSVRQLLGKTLPFPASALQAESWFKEKVNPQLSLKLTHGSGISSASRMSPKDMTDVLLKADQSSYGGVYFQSLLSISGWNGWIMDRLFLPETALRVWGKTGSLDYASGLAGYFHAQSGKRYAFALFVTDFPRRKKADQAGGYRSPRLVANASRWRNKALELQDQIVSEWVQNL